jgi:hypothetical protein
VILQLFFKNKYLVSNLVDIWDKKEPRIEIQGCNQTKLNENTNIWILFLEWYLGSLTLYAKAVGWLGRWGTGKSKARGVRVLVLRFKFGFRPVMY